MAVREGNWMTSDREKRERVSQELSQLKQMSKSLRSRSMQSFLDDFPRLANPLEIRKVQGELPVYIFSGSEDPVGQKLEGVRVLIDRYRSAGFTSITHDFYSGGRHEMLHEINRRDVITNLLVWISGLLNRTR